MNIAEEITFGYADTGMVRLHYATAGTGEKLVVLLHGFPEFWYSWRHQLKALSTEYTVVAPDLRGYNLSDKPPKTSDYETEHIVSDIVGLIGHFGREKAAVIGHDWGAAVAWTMAFKRPDLLSKVAALQVPPPAVWKKNQTMSQFFASWYMFFFQVPSVPEFLFERNDHEMLVKALTESTGRPGVFTAGDIAEFKKSWDQPGAATAMLNYYRANIMKRMFGKADPPAKVEVPTLFIYGEKDKAVLPLTVAGVGDMISAPFREHRIPDSGHWVQQEAPDEVTRVLQEFLAD